MITNAAATAAAAAAATDGGVFCGGAAADDDDDDDGAGAFALPLISSADTSVLANRVNCSMKPKRRTTVAPADDHLPCCFVAAKLGMLAFNIYDNYKYINIFVVTGRIGMIELDLDDKGYVKGDAADH